MTSKNNLRFKNVWEVVDLSLKVVDFYNAKCSYSRNQIGSPKKTNKNNLNKFVTAIAKVV